jgi:hypothetical protein
MAHDFGERIKKIFVRDRQLAADVRSEFEKVMATSWPQFELVLDAAKIHPMYAEEEELPEEFGEDTMGGWRLFRWQTDVNVWFFLEVGVEHNKFRLTLLWNTADKLPLGVDCTFADEPWLHAKNGCTPMASNRSRSWTVGTNPAYVPAVVVPGAIAEMKAFAEPIIAKVLAHHGTR